MPEGYFKRGDTLGNIRQGISRLCQNCKGKGIEETIKLLVTNDFGAQLAAANNAVAVAKSKAGTSSEAEENKNVLIVYKELLSELIDEIEKLAIPNPYVPDVFQEFKRQTKAIETMEKRWGRPTTPAVDENFRNSLGALNDTIFKNEFYIVLTKAIDQAQQTVQAGRKKPPVPPHPAKPSAGNAPNTGGKVPPVRQKYPWSPVDPAKDPDRKTPSRTWNRPNAKQPDPSVGDNKTSNVPKKPAKQPPGQPPGQLPGPNRGRDPKSWRNSEDFPSPPANKPEPGRLDLSNWKVPPPGSQQPPKGTPKPWTKPPAATEPKPPSTTAPVPKKQDDDTSVVSLKPGSDPLTVESANILRMAKVLGKQSTVDMALTGKANKEQVTTDAKTLVDALVTKAEGLKEESSKPGAERKQPTDRQHYERDDAEKQLLFKGLTAGKTAEMSSHVNGMIDFTNEQGVKLSGLIEVQVTKKPNSSDFKDIDIKADLSALGSDDRLRALRTQAEVSAAAARKSVRTVAVVSNENSSSALELSVMLLAQGLAVKFDPATQDRIQELISSGQASPIDQARAQLMNQWQQKYKSGEYKKAALLIKDHIEQVEVKVVAARDQDRKDAHLGTANARIDVAQESAARTNTTYGLSSESPTPTNNEVKPQSPKSPGITPN